MRAREKKMSDYGMTQEEVDMIKKKCRSLSVQDKLDLLHAAISAAPGLEIYIYDSLTTGRGYDYINRRRPIPCKRDDFYAYQRKTIEALYRQKRLFGRWEY